MAQGHIYPTTSVAELEAHPHEDGYPIQGDVLNYYFREYPEHITTVGVYLP